MKKIKPFLALAAVAVVGAIVGGVELSDIMTFLFGGSGVAMAMAGVVGTPTNDAVNAADMEDAGIVDQDLSRDIALFNPDRFPLDTLTRELLRKKKPADSQKVKYFQKSTKPFNDTLDSSVDSNTGSSDSAPANQHIADAGTSYIWVKVDTPSTWRTKDTLKMNDLSITEVVGTGDYFKSDVVFQVTEKKDSALKLTPISGTKNSSGKFVVPTFTKDIILYRLGNAMSEKDMTTEPFAVYPDEYEQYCQNFMAQIEETTFASITSKKVDWDFNDMEAENIYSMRGEMEASFLFGERYEIKNGSDTTLFTGGITRSIDKHLFYGELDGSGKRINTHLTKEMYTKWMKELFTGNNGSKERVLLAGAGLIEEISLLRETYKTMQNNTNMETFLGVKCTAIVSDFGTLKIVHDPILDEEGWSSKGIAIDLEHLYKKEFVPMKATEIDLRGSGQRNANAKVIQEVSCLVLRHPDCHAIIELSPVA